MGLYIKQNGAIKPLAGSTPGEGLPVGAITAFTANSIPSGWLLCDGSTFDETLYPALFLALGGNVLPDLRNRFLEGANSVVREYKEAGLPNITGTSGVLRAANGAFYRNDDDLVTKVQSSTTGNEVALSNSRINDFDASKGETKTDGTLKTEDEAHVYGNSDTVQPASYTVNYIIKATSGITTEAALDAFNMIKEYERKQNLLSDIELINTTAGTDNTAEYDGYLIVSCQSSPGGPSFARDFYINGVALYDYCIASAGYYSGTSITIPIKKGDVWTVGETLYVNIYGRWFKERDYEGRV